MDVTVIGGSNTGGLVGFASGSVTIYHSSTQGTQVKVQGTENVGGLVGYLRVGTIVDSYSRIAVDGGTGNNVGGLVGQTGFSASTSSGAGNIYRSYSTGAVTGLGNRVNGFLGLHTRGTYADNYWDMETSCHEASAGGVGVVGKTTAEMQERATYRNWNFYTL